MNKKDKKYLDNIENRKDLVETFSQRNNYYDGDYMEEYNGDNLQDNLVE